MPGLETSGGRLLFVLNNEADIGKDRRRMVRLGCQICSRHGFGQDYFKITITNRCKPMSCA